LAFHFSFNQNKLWTNWRSKGSFIQQTQYFRQSVRWKPMFFRTDLIFTGFVRRTGMFGNLWLFTQARQSSHLRYFRSLLPILLARTVVLVAKFEDWVLTAHNRGYYEGQKPKGKSINVNYWWNMCNTSTKSQYFINDWYLGQIFSLYTCNYGFIYLQILA
jgi:hypothetical protein